MYKLIASGHSFKGSKAVKSVFSLINNFHSKIKESAPVKQVLLFYSSPISEGTSKGKDKIVVFLRKIGGKDTNYIHFTLIGSIQKCPFLARTNLKNSNKYSPALL